MFTQKQLKAFVEEEFGPKKEFEKVQNPLIGAKNREKYQLYDLKYYEDEVSLIERIQPAPESVTFQVGQDTLITRKFLTYEHPTEVDSFTYYTHVRSKDEGKKPHASIVMLHGHSENSDAFLEYAIHHAMNNFDVHLVDFRGQGLSSGPRGGHYRMQENQLVVQAALKQVRTDLPCFIQAHSMGCMVSTVFLINNPHLKIAGLMVGSPFYSFGTQQNISTFRRQLAQFMANNLEELPLNGPGSTHNLAADRRYLLWEYFGNCKRHAYAISGGVICSMMESLEDLQLNAKELNKPILVMLAGQEKTVSNDATRTFLKNCGSTDKNVVDFPTANHNIHKEPDSKPQQLATIYEFMHNRLNSPNFDVHDLDQTLIGRTKKKKSIKVKRSVFKLYLSFYLFYGVLLTILRRFMRYKNGKPGLTRRDVLMGILAWPGFLYRIWYKLAQIYYS